MKLEVTGPMGCLYDGNALKGLWFAQSADTRNSMRIATCISMQEITNGRTTSSGDYTAATTGACVIKPGPEDLGGFLICFPSSGIR